MLRIYAETLDRLRIRLNIMYLVFAIVLLEDITFNNSVLTLVELCMH